jgi:hypothetical protein
MTYALLSIIYLQEVLCLILRLGYFSIGRRSLTREVLFLTQYARPMQLPSAGVLVVLPYPLFNG